MADALDDVVHAARFQPAHLAQLMRDLFPTDAGGRGARVTTHHVGLAVAPALLGRALAHHPAHDRPPARSPSRATLPRIDPLPTPPPQRSFMARGSTWGALALGMIGVGVGRVHHPQHSRRWRWSARRAGTRCRAQEVRDRRALDPRRRRRSTWLGENHFLGTTDTYLPFEIKDDARISLVFKKDGYQDETREVSPYPMLVHMKPLERRREARARARRPAAEAGAEPPPPSRRTGVPAPVRRPAHAALDRPRRCPPQPPTPPAPPPAAARRSRHRRCRRRRCPATAAPRPRASAAPASRRAPNDLASAPQTRIPTGSPARSDVTEPARRRAGCPDVSRPPHRRRRARPTTRPTRSRAPSARSPGSSITCWWSTTPAPTTPRRLADAHPAAGPGGDPPRAQPGRGRGHRHRLRAGRWRWARTSPR